jgi:hypothetical protein
MTLSPYFVHIPKNMGNFIYKNYYNINQTDKTRFYGLYDSIYDYYDTYGIPYSKKDENIVYNSTISIDHLTLEELLNLGILFKKDLEERFVFAIVREPIDRFISLCNYWNVPPNQIIYNITKIHLLKKMKYNLYQHFRPQSDYIKDIKKHAKKYRIFFMNKPHEIRDVLATYFPDKQVDFGEKIYKSRDTYNRSMLSRENMAFLQNYYREDFLLRSQSFLKI